MRAEDAAKKRALSLLGLPEEIEGEVSLLCPWHSDNSPSASLSSEGKFYCFSCEKALSSWYSILEELMDIREEEEEEEQFSYDATMSPPFIGEELLKKAALFLETRALPLDSMDVDLDVVIEDDPMSPHYGYLTFIDLDGAKVKRNLLPNENPRYLSEKGDSRIFWVRNRGSNLVWLVEGVTDGLALSLCTKEDIAVALGAKGATKSKLYALRNRKVIICFDPDWPGFSGASEAKKAAAYIGSSVWVKESPFPGDFGDTWVTSPEAMAQWVTGVESSYSDGDSSYVAKMWSEDSPMIWVPTGIPLLDSLLGGGLKPGITVLGAVPGFGKTTFAVHCAKAAIERGKKVLFCTYEISKRQMWARLVSMNDRSWVEIEANPSEGSKEEKERARILAKNCRVCSGFGYRQIESLREEFDLIIIDYLQRMPGESSKDGKEVKENIARLSDLARDKEIPILVISSLSRMGYSDVNGMSGFKESGDIEYVSQTLLKGNPTAEKGTITLSVVKNTRGPTNVNISLGVNFAHQIIFSAVRETST